MKINDIIDYSLASIARRVKEAPSQKLAELAANNVSRSTFAITETFSVLTDTMKSELLSFIQELSQTNIKTRHIFDLQNKLHLFVQVQYNEHEEYLKTLSIFDKFSGSLMNDFIKKELEDVLSSVELKVMILEKKLSDQRKQIFWDLCKMALSAIIGGLIGAYLKNLIGF
ncbi:hypothetical protein D3C74_140840 [compost metagenome]